MRDPGILILAKAPLAGQVKTRLCPPCTYAEAAAIAQAALSDTLDAAVATGSPVVLALDGAPGAWLPPRVCVVAQVRGTFNDRLAAAWSRLPNGGVQIGMDTPQVTPALLGAALEATRSSGAALGLATDGGWWILGLAAPDARVFAEVPMSTSGTGVAQLRRLRTLGYEPRLLPELSDVDTWPDACTVADLVPRSRTRHTVARVASRLTAGVRAT
jgi:glycosyltransferase A (GT-A) superfamily protein (DUF2064 family)